MLEVQKCRTQRIMVVDDEEFCLTTIQSLLFNNGIDTENRVDYCITGQEALEKLKNAYKEDHAYCIIFTDFNMPVMSGIESTLHMRTYLEKERNIKRSLQPIIIGVTGHMLKEYQEEGIDAGMDEIYSKPLYAT
jgi:CheY-like chemotaxis protein